MAWFAKLKEATASLSATIAEAASNVTEAASNLAAQGLNLDALQVDNSSMICSFSVAGLLRVAI
jgi:hypothetical protein